MGQVETGRRRVWRRSTYIWVLGGLAAVSALIYWEQTALLFVLSTLAMSVLLLVVAFADLEGRDKALHQPDTESNRTNDTNTVLSGSSTRKRAAS